MIICETIDQIKDAVATASAKDYAARTQALVDNQTRASAFINLHERAAKALAARLENTAKAG